MILMYIFFGLIFLVSLVSSITEAVRVSKQDNIVFAILIWLFPLIILGIAGFFGYMIFKG